MTNSKDTDIFQTGDLLNNTYRIEGILGRGGTSEVYKARSEISKRVVALKALRTEFSMNDDYLVLNLNIHLNVADTVQTPLRLLPELCTFQYIINRLVPKFPITSY